MMKPIQIRDEMIRIILSWNKMLTRRVVIPQPFSVVQDENVSCWCGHFVSEDWKVLVDKMPYSPGDILYAQETWGKDPDGRYVYRASCHDNYATLVNWSPSIHMPREAARIFLRVMNVKVERLQDIVTGDYRTPLNINAEGLILPCCHCIHINGDCKDFIVNDTCRLLKDYIKLWDSTIKPAELALYGWVANPWVWVISFERINKEEAIKSAEIKN